MSSALGLAAVAATLQQLLESGFAELKLADVLASTGALVSCLAPDRIDRSADQSRLNLYLYNQQRNPGWANLGLPSRDSRGERVGNPALALDLYFLVSAYGAEDFHSEILLGAAMQILHETPGLGREAIKALLKPGPSKPSLPKELELAGLADQLEQLRITPLNHSMDEIARIWSTIQVPARPSAAYQVSVVLLEVQKSQRTPLPVLARNLYAVPLRSPRLDRVETIDGAPILPDSSLRLTGANLRAQSVQLRLNGLDISAGISQLGNDSLQFDLLAPALPEGLQAGVCTLQVVHPQLMGNPPQPHSGQESNLLALVLNPQAGFSVEPGASSQVVDGQTYRSGAISVTCTPAIGPRQRVRLLLNEKNPPADRAPRAYSFSAVDGNGVLPPAESTSSVTIEFRHVLQGSYLARLQVDAGSSPLNLGADGRFSGPEVSP